MGDSHKESHLACEESQHGCGEDPYIVFPVDLLLGHECRQQPEKRAGNKRPECEDSQRRNEVSAGEVLAHDDVEAEDGICHQCRSMSYDGILCCHILVWFSGANIEIYQRNSLFPWITLAKQNFRSGVR